jgi:hypothetical protein
MLSLVANSQDTGSISGKIEDNENGEALPEVQVVASNRWINFLFLVKL